MIAKTLWLYCLLVTTAACQELDLDWRKLANVPAPHGLAGAFAGTHGATLLAGGGANFPDRPPWLGGEKIWHDQVWALDKPEGSWQAVGRLPRPLGYGVSISTEDGVVCIGGSDADRHYTDVFKMSLRGGLLEIKPLPDLPGPIANACGAMLGTTIYIAGGIESPNSTNTSKSFLALDMTATPLRWTELETWPGSGRMLSAASSQNGFFFLISGADLFADSEGRPTRRYLNDAFRFEPRVGWSRIADLPNSCVAAPSPAPTSGAARFLVIGGDDGSKVGFQPTQEHPGFSNIIHSYDTTHNSWTRVGYTPAPRVTAPVVKWGEQWLIISGEQRPGIRSPEIWSLRQLAD